MKGLIHEINWQKGMVAVLTETENFSVFEIQSDDNFEIGDEIFWEEHRPLGDCTIKNLSKNETSEVYFQNHWISSDNLKQQLLY